MIRDNDNGIYALRVYYKRQGCAIWLSKEEISRFFECAIRRAKLPYRINVYNYFNMVIFFNWNVGNKLNSKSESFDLQISDYIEPDKCLNSLQKVCVSFLMPFKCQYL